MFEDDYDYIPDNQLNNIDPIYIIDMTDPNLTDLERREIADKNWQERKENKKLEKENLKKKEEENKKLEKERIDNLGCPLCKSKEKKIVKYSESNGVCGSGYYSNIIFEFYICQNCGIVYKDLNKKYEKK